jgi:DNA polymerase-3 subunit beta
MSFQTRVPVMVLEAGSATVFGEKFMGILNSIPDGEITFEQTDNKFVISCDGTDGNKKKRIKFELKTIASDTFPDTPSEENVRFFDTQAADLKEMIDQTVFAVSTDETRYYMTGVYFEKKPVRADGDQSALVDASGAQLADLHDSGKIAMVATDGRRLAYVNKSIADPAVEFAGAIVPTKILNIVNKPLGREGNVSVGVTDKTVFINFGPYHFSSMLLEGKFPSYRRVVPVSQAHSFTINRREFLEAIRRVAQVMEKRVNRIYLNLSEGQMTITSEEGDIGNGEEVLDCQYTGDDTRIPINYTYLEDPLKAIYTDAVTVNFTETNRAITMRPEPEADFFDIIMPMQAD